MTWNYRIIRNKNGDYGVYEIYYDDDGSIKTFTEKPITGLYDDINVLVADVRTMLNEVEKDMVDRGVLEMPNLKP